MMVLVGKESNRDAVGSLVTVRVGGKTMAQAVLSGRGYQSLFTIQCENTLKWAKRLSSINLTFLGDNRLNCLYSA